jgi:hypothetical protein
MRVYNSFHFGSLFGLYYYFWRIYGWGGVFATVLCGYGALCVLCTWHRNTNTVPSVPTNMYNTGTVGKFLNLNLRKEVGFTRSAV